jgi:hypothetical protein
LLGDSLFNDSFSFGDRDEYETFDPFFLGFWSFHKDHLCSTFFFSLVWGWSFSSFDVFLPNHSAFAWFVRLLSEIQPMTIKTGGFRIGSEKHQGDGSPRILTKT